jgi:hypothetical protein
MPGRFLVGIGRNILTMISRLARRATDFCFALDNYRDGGSQYTIGVISMRVWAIAACVILGFAGASSANPLDSPGTVYMDGLPCNLACQSYMAWSRRSLRATQATVAGGSYGAAGKAAGEAPRKRLSRRSTPNSVDASPRKKKSADLQTALATAPDPAPLPKPRSENTPHNVETPELARERTPKENIMAALAVAELITSAEETPRSTDNDVTEGTKDVPANGANGALVVLLISRSDVKSASALNGLSIAIDAAQSGVEEENIRSSLVAAGAVETQLSVSDANPLDRLVRGEVPAAVLHLVSPAAADAFPEIKGFKVLRIPLSAR